MNLYEELELSQFWTEEEIKLKYRTLASIHHPDKGGDASNLLLSQNRAKSVIIYLEQKGITNTRMIAKGFGESKPIANNEAAEGRELNRRVEFKLVK